MRSARLLAQLFVLVMLTALTLPAPTQAAASAVSVYLTTPDKADKLSQKTDITWSTGTSSQSKLIHINDDATFQRMFGFGASLTDSTVYLMQTKMSETQRNDLMNKYFHPTDGLNINLLRQPIGGSDQNRTNSGCHTYDDNGGNADPNLTNFSIAWDTTATNGVSTVSLLKQAKDINTSLKIVGSTWCVPDWMESGTGSSRALSSSYYGTYANYLVKYIEAYNAQGLPIYAITLQNEPSGGVNFGNNLTASQANILIKSHVGPTFAANNTAKDVKIYAFDHNWSDPSYPELILGDSDTNPYVAGTAWHWYNGKVSAQKRVHDAFPDKSTWYTEGSTPTYNSSDWSKELRHVFRDRDLIGILRNWSETFIMFTMLSNTDFGPGECTRCGAIAYVNESNGNITLSADYYILGHMSKYIQRDAYRIASNEFGSGDIRNVAFKNPDGSYVLIAYNDGDTSQTFGVQWGNEHFSYTLPANALVTLKWSGTRQGAATSLQVQETEDLVVASKSSDKHRTFGNNDNSDSNLSGGYGMILESNAVNDYVTYQVNVPEKRTYRIKVGVKTGGDRGTFQLAIAAKDGSTFTNHGSTKDLYTSNFGYTEVDIGNVTFGSAGEKWFRFTVTGKNTNSSGHKLALDYIKLVLP